ncbi:DUF3284 domain-containing protein [Enterococcus termitis]|uniref:DUF3284 domain-containing protein n=1 Tax=Enterococcus termitis TaxID=332950 RepID=A0A1E5GAU2_9ENTE|nr:DUF3284 domain-containing protein [Enterococcus termitis]OEG09771.1 hypothetical protein BCR25_09685 [Enterococcus termitis]OJG96899.1 hypothetical protein RV18_GL001737 [Enterococcus termitis]
MRVDTLSYTHTMTSDLSAVFKAVMAEQLSYFQRQDASVLSLEEGTSITCHLLTKTQKIGVENTMTILKLEENRCIQMKTTSATGDIIQTYDFKEKGGNTLVTYSEKNMFEQSRNQFGFMLVGLLYKFFYNRGIKQRMTYLDSLADTRFN